MKTFTLPYTRYLVSPPHLKRHAWNDMPFGLLGQASFFAHFDVKFSYSDKALYFSYR